MKQKVYPKFMKIKIIQDYGKLCLILDGLITNLKYCSLTRCIRNELQTISDNYLFWWIQFLSI